MRRRRSGRMLLVGALLAAAGGAAASVLAYRRAASRAALARVVALTRETATYPERMRREQVELLAERDRLKRTIDGAEVDALVRRDLRASPERAELVQERAAQEPLRRERDELRQAHHARYRITRLELDIQQLASELAELDGTEPPRPPGEDG